MRIFKYPVIFGCKLPEFTQPLAVGAQDGKIFIWATHDEATNSEWEIWVQVTGRDFPSSEIGHYIGTVFIENFVYHIFARKL